MPDGRIMYGVPRAVRRAMIPPQLKDVIQQPLYDTVRIPHGTSQKYTLFQEKRGQGVSAVVGTGTKTELDTNLIEQGRIPKGYLYRITGIGIEGVAQYDGTNYAPVSPSVLANFLLNALVKLNIGEKTYLVVPASGIPAGVGIYTAATTVATAGLPAPNMTFKKLNIPHNLSENRNFEVILDNTVGNPYNFGAGVSLIIRVWLDGIMWRIVQ